MLRYVIVFHDIDVFNCCTCSIILSIRLLKIGNTLFLYNSFRSVQKHIIDKDMNGHDILNRVPQGLILDPII